MSFPIRFILLKRLLKIGFFIQQLIMLSLGKSKEPRRPVDIKQLSPPKAKVYTSLSASDVQGTSNQVIQSFAFRIQQPVSVDQPTTCWQYNIPILRPNEKQISILTEAFQAIILDYIGQSFPQTISIAFKNFAGFIGKTGQQTNKFIVMDLVGTSIKSVAGLTSRDLIYKSQSINFWNLGSLRDLKMEVYVDDQTTPVTFPISNPINVNFKIVHVGY